MRSRLVGGFTLIEVLVAVFVLAVGVMGAVAAQTVALRTRQESALMSHGVQLATSFADRMRANTAQMRLPPSGYYAALMRGCDVDNWEVDSYRRSKPRSLSG